jgi:hypothetical protein
MSAEVAARVAVIAALRADGALMDGLNGLFDGEPGRASAPYGYVGECIGADWGGKDVEGRELRLSIGLRSADETPVRLGAMIGRIDPALAAALVQDGWRIVTARLIRSRVARDDGREPGGWRAVVDYRLRVVREG